MLFANILALACYQLMLFLERTEGNIYPRFQWTSRNSTVHFYCKSSSIEILWRYTPYWGAFSGNANRDVTSIGSKFVSGYRIMVGSGLGMLSIVCTGHNNNYKFKEEVMLTILS